MTHPLKEMDFGILGFVNYKGVLVEKIIGGYKVLGQVTINESGVDEIIKEAGDNLSKSIVNVGNFECTNKIL